MNRRSFLVGASMFLADKLLAGSLSLDDIAGISNGSDITPLDAEQYEKEMANRAWKKFSQTGVIAGCKLVQNEAIQKRVQLMAVPLCETSIRKGLEWRIILVDSPRITACTYGGGLIIVDTELVRFCKNEEEFAGVIAHEVGHNEYRHHQKTFLAKGLYHELSSLREINNRGVSRDLGGFLNDLGFLAYKGFRRLNENEADAYVVNAFFKSGYDVKKSSAFSEMLVRLTGSRSYANIKNCLYSSHPESKERLERVRGIESSYNNKVSLGRDGAFVELQALVKSYKA